MNTELRMSPQLERIAKQLAARYGMDWRAKGAYLILAMPERPERWLLINLDGERFSLTCCLVEPDESLTPEVDMILTMHAAGWEPIELLYSNEAFTSYVQAAQAANLPVYDGEGNLRFDTFTEYFAQVLEAQGWLGHGYRIPDPESVGQMAGSPSTHRIAGYRHVGQCVGCGKMISAAEGARDYPEMCDDCWAMCQATLEEWETHAVTTLNRPLHLVCDCSEQCGTVLKLTHDGFLVLEDKDGLRVSFMLPDWLDFAMRWALLANTTAADDAASIQADSAALSGLEDDVPF